MNGNSFPSEKLTAMSGWDAQKNLSVPPSPCHSILSLMFDAKCRTLITSALIRKKQKSQSGVVYCGESQRETEEAFKRRGWQKIKIKKRRRKRKDKKINYITSLLVFLPVHSFPLFYLFSIEGRTLFFITSYKIGQNTH